MTTFGEGIWLRWVDPMRRSTVPGWAASDDRFDRIVDAARAGTAPAPRTL